MCEGKVAYVGKPNKNNTILSIEAFTDMIEEQEIHMKGYAYDSLCLRYKEARFKQAQLEMEIDYREGNRQHTREHYKQMANRDFMRFCQILNDVIGEHD